MNGFVLLFIALSHCSAHRLYRGGACPRLVCAQSRLSFLYFFFDELDCVLATPVGHSFAHL
jgi:hypothetical protein